jgi:hypothetical protein
LTVISLFFPLLSFLHLHVVLLFPTRSSSFLLSL